MIHDDAETRWDTSLWHATNPARPERPPLDGAKKVDLAIVGGGFTGLSTALHAAERGLSVILLEAETLAFGATGRNAGFVVPNFAKVDPDAVMTRLGPERGERLLALVEGGADVVFDLAARHAPACDAQRAGWIQPAHSAAAFERIKRRAAQWAARGRPAAVLDRDAVTAATGVTGFSGGWIDRSGGAIDPVAFANGLADAAERAGAHLHERSRVTALDPASSRWRVSTAGGAVDAEKVVLATNAYAGPLHAGLARSFFPLTVFQIATRPLPSALRRRLLPGASCVSDSRRNLFTFRFDASDRLITGGMAVLSPGADRRVPRTIHRRLATMMAIPDLPPIAFAWSGQAAVMPDFLPRLVDLAPGLIGAIGCNGRGIVMTTQLGRVLADWADGSAPADLPVPITLPAPLPWHGLMRHAPNVLLPLSVMRDAIETRRG